MKRILSLDGGGSWALIQVRALIDIYGYNATGYDVLRDFDLIVANSGGSIVAGTLAAGWPLLQSLDLFLSEANRKSIFVAGPWLDRVENAVLGLGPKYGTGDKFVGLTSLFGAFAQTPMDQLPTTLSVPLGKRVDFIISSFDYDRKRAVLFRSNTASVVAPIVQVPVATISAAIHASSTAPVNYFDKPATFPTTTHVFDSFRFWDGGISGMNNPVLVGVMELLGSGVVASDIQVLSIGAGTVRRPIPPELGAAPSNLFQTPANPGTVSDLKELAASIVDDPPDHATYMAYLALGGVLPKSAAEAPLVPNGFIRLSPMVQPRCMTSDLVNLSSDPTDLKVPDLQDDILAPQKQSEDNFGALAVLDMDAIEADQVNLLQLLTNTWIAGGIYNQPIRSNTTFGCEIGHRFFPAAKAAWLVNVGRAAPTDLPAPPGPEGPSTK
jgi:hypothetical protein